MAQWPRPAGPVVTLFPQPLIVTAALDDAAFARFEDLRQTHFPPLRNLVPAHLTLFHALPGDEAALIRERLSEVCRGQMPIRVEVQRPRSLGRGVAYWLDAPELQRLRQTLKTEFSPWLTPQDSAPYRPHITVQNKVEPADARSLLESLDAAFKPFDIRVEGLLLWRYLGGPWERLGRFDFQRADPAAVFNAPAPGEAEGRHEPRDSEIGLNVRTGSGPD